MKKHLLTGLFWAILITTFILLSASVSLVAAGYQFDWQSKRLQKTALFYFAGEPKTATVTVNGAVVANELPLRIPSLFPGEYAVRVEKAGYAPWYKTFTIAAGQAIAQTEIKLFLALPEVAAVTDPEVIDQVKKQSPSSSLVAGNELRFNNRLVTRTSSPIVTAAIADDRAHVFFQIGKEIRVIEMDGTNEVLLFTLDAENNSQLLPTEADRELLIIDGPTVKRLRVR